MDRADELEALAERVEALTRPDREVDAEVALAFGYVRDEFCCTNINGSSERGLLWFPPYFTADDKAGAISEYRSSVAANFWPESDPPAFTASLDAAMSLVPEGWLPAVQAFARGNECKPAYHRGTLRRWTRNEQGDVSFEKLHGIATTPALALVAAALRALAAERGK
jgi:hypothetical protein